MESAAGASSSLIIMTAVPWTGGSDGISRAIITRMEAVLIVALFSGFLAVLAAVVVVTPHLVSHRQFVRTSQGRPMPFRRHTLLFSRADRALYRALRSFVPDHMIFAKVKLADLVSIIPGQSSWNQFSPINRKYIDFVVCDATLSPVLAIELEHQVHSLKSDRSTVDQVKSMLANASVPVVHIPQKRQYLFNELRRLLRPYLTLPHPLV